MREKGEGIREGRRDRERRKERGEGEVRRERRGESVSLGIKINQ